MVLFECDKNRSGLDFVFYQPLGLEYADFGEFTVKYLLFSDMS